ADTRTWFTPMIVPLAPHDKRNVGRPPGRRREETCGAAKSPPARLGQERHMPTVNMLEAKSNLSRLVDAVESGAESEIIIERNGRPAPRLVGIRPARRGPRR